MKAYKYRRCEVPSRRDSSSAPRSALSSSFRLFQIRDATLISFEYHRVTINVPGHTKYQEYAPDAVKRVEGVPEGMGTEKGSLCGKHDTTHLHHFGVKKDL